jgi:hypothetical protein
VSTRLLDAFRDAFAGKVYRHRDQTIGNFIVNHLYEDLLLLGRSPKLAEGVRVGRLVVNIGNIVTGRAGRRGDGAFGDLVPNEEAHGETGFQVQRGPLATMRIAAESKILAKAMIKQIDRVINDLEGQAATFRRQSPDAVCVAVVGVNHATEYVSYEGERSFVAKPAPIREAPKAIARLQARAASAFDEFIILRFRATNVEPYPFAWVDPGETRREYGAALLRVSQLFERRF